MQLVVGRILRPHGLRGEVVVEVRTDLPRQRFAPGAALATDQPGGGTLRVTAARWHSGRLLVSFAGCADRTAAEELRGVILVVDSSELAPSDDPDEFADHELLGLTAVTIAGERVGVVADVRHHGQDLLVIDGAGERSGDQILVPFVRPLVPEVDLAAGRLVIDPPPGLLDPGNAS
jgi:16S rRNA processing protein RimM